MTPEQMREREAGRPVQPTPQKTDAEKFRDFQRESKRLRGKLKAQSRWLRVVK